jgi:hypothetical protein
MLDLIILILTFYASSIIGPVIFFKLLLLNMQIFFYWIFTNIYMFVKHINIMDYMWFFGVKKSTNLNTDLYFDLDENPVNLWIQKVENPKSDEFFDQYDFSKLIEQFFEFFFIYKWFLLPICLYLFLLYILHAILGLYSAYVDYFQKNPDHFDSMRAILPAIFIFYLIIFIFFALILFFCLLYLHYIIWFLLI